MPAFSTWLNTRDASMESWKQYVSFSGSPGTACYTMIGRTGLLPEGAIERFGTNTDYVDYPTDGIVDVRAITMIYADGPLAHTSNVVRRSPLT